MDIPTFTKANISEDCLYMNIFVPNVSLFCKFLILFNFEWMQVLILDLKF